MKIYLLTTNFIPTSTKMITHFTRQKLHLFHTLVVLFLAFISSQGAFAQTFSAGSLPAALPDPGDVNRTITVSGLSGTVASANEVQVNFTVDHSWAGDIVVGITPPGGTEIIIVNRIGSTVSGSNSNFTTGAPISIRQNATQSLPLGNIGDIATGTYLPTGRSVQSFPVGSLASLVGASRNGNWNMRVGDGESIITGTWHAGSITFFDVPSSCTTPTAFNMTGGGTYCAGGIGAAMGLDGSESGVNYQLKKGGVNVGNAVPGTGSSISFGNHTTGGTYTVEATRVNGSCTANMTGSATITEPSPIVFGIPSVTNASCNGGTDGSVTVSATGGTGAITYSIAPSVGTQSPSGTFSNLTAQTYTFTATDQNGCTATTTATVSQSSSIAFGTPTVTNVSCNGGNNGRVVVLATGGNGTKTYSIAPSVGTQSPSGTFNNLTAQTYTFTATDQSGCTATTTAMVSQPTAITFGTPTVTNVKCAGGNSGRVVVSATGGTGAITYTISPSGGSQSPSGTFNNLTARTYTFTATDANGCTKTTTATVGTNTNQPPIVTLTAPANGATLVTNTTLSATASDPDGTIASVNFYWVVGNTKTGTVSRQLLGSDNTAPYTYDWLNMPGGNYNIQAEAVDDCGVTTSSSIANVNVLETFTVMLGTSLNGQTFVPGSSLTLTASIVAFTSRTITKVEFFAGNTKLGEDLTAPYTYTWNSVPSGNYYLRAVATDNMGGVWYSPYTYVLSVNTNRATPQGQLGATVQQNVEDFMLYQNQPNPVSNETIIGFNLPKDGSARLTITAIDGRVVKVINGEYKAGFNAISINKAELRSNGVFYYSLETAGQSASKKMVIVE
ncbi:MAG: T9SS type A sorting domain-containing protein [Saprospiraceae bacterium]|nr:T9SS type A sorting domain-containing protein [Saprospiraceae bacterium]